MADRFRAFDLVIASELGLPELPVCAPDMPADVTIRFGQAHRPDSAHAHQLGPTAWACPQWLWLEVAGIATFLVSGGRDIIIQPCEGIDEPSLRLFLLGSVIGGLLLQRGHLVLHGNAIVIDGQALVCVGESGAGKSTLAHQFQQLGFPVLADDVVAIDHSQRVLPGIPRVKLWRDVLDRLDLATQNLTRVRADLEKYVLPLATGDKAASAVPVRWVCALKAAHVDAVEIKEVTGHAAFGLLFDNLYRPHLAQHTLTSSALLAALGGVTRAADISSVRRPIARFALDDLVESLRNHVETHP